MHAHTSAAYLMHFDVMPIVLLQDQWYPDLLSTVKKINQTFQRNFKDIGCAGEVSLAEHADYDKFAVQIRQVLLVGYASSMHQACMKQAGLSCIDTRIRQTRPSSKCHACAFWSFA